MKTLLVSLLLIGSAYGGTEAPVLLERPVTPHRFLDRGNVVLFTGTAVSMAGDGITTRRFLRLGGREMNPVARPFVRTTGGTVAYFAGGTVAVVGVAALAHRTGHHRLERWLPIITTVVESGWVVWNAHLQRPGAIAPRPTILKASAL